MRSRLVLVLIALSLLAVASACSDDGGTLSSATSSSTDAGPTTSTSVEPDEPDEPAATTTTEFVPPRPQTTPNVSQPPDSLLDGTHVVFLVEVNVDERTVVFDLVQWFYREDFEQAIADGRLAADDPCVELDYCIVNTNQATRAMDVSDDARVSVIDYDDCCTFRRTDDLTDARTRLDESRDLFLVTAKDGELVALDEVYLS